MLKTLVNEIVKLVSAYLSLILILYIIVVRLLFFLLPDSLTINQFFSEISNLRLLLIAIFLLLSICWIISHNQQKQSIINPFKLPRDELIAITATSLLFSYFFLKSFSLFGASPRVSFLLLSLFFLFNLTQIIEFYKTYQYGNFHTLKIVLVDIFKPENIRKHTHNLLLLSLIILLVGYSLSVTAYSLYKYQNYRQILKQNLIIENISPESTTYAYDVRLDGYNFGEIPGKKYKLYSTYGPVTTSEYSDNKIVFEIPLHWKEGVVNLWVERPNKYDPKKTISSNVVKLNLLHRWTFYPTKNDNVQVRAFKRILRTVYLDYWNNLYSNLSLQFLR